MSAWKIRLRKYPKEVKNREKGTRRLEDHCTRSNIQIIGFPERENGENGGKENFKQIIQENFPEQKGYEFLDWKGLWEPSTMDESKPDRAISDHHGWWEDSTSFERVKINFM